MTIVLSILVAIWCAHAADFKVLLSCNVIRLWRQRVVYGNLLPFHLRGTLACSVLSESNSVHLLLRTIRQANFPRANFHSSLILRGGGVFCERATVTSNCNMWMVTFWSHRHHVYMKEGREGVLSHRAFVSHRFLVDVGWVEKQQCTCGGSIQCFRLEEQDFHDVIYVCTLDAQQCALFLRLCIVFSPLCWSNKSQLRNCAEFTVVVCKCQIVANNK